MAPESIEVQPELERLGYFKLSYEDLERINDVESMLERGLRLFYAIGTKVCHEKALAFIRKASKRGHPVARSFDITESSGDVPDECIKSATRGHHFGVNTQAYRAY